MTITTLSMMDDAALLAWAKEFRGLQLGTTIGKRAGAPITLAYSVGELPAVSVANVMAYGGQRKVNDGIGGADTSIEDKVKAARVTIDQLKAGITGRSRGEAVDPFMVIVLRVVRKAVKAKSAENYKAIMAGDKPDDVFKAILEKHRAADTPQYKAIMAEATLIRKQQEDLARQKAEAPIAIGMDDL